MDTQELTRLFDHPVIIHDIPDPLPDRRAVVISFESGELILIHNYHGPREPRPLVCVRHGAQRHDWDGAKFVCAKCRPIDRPVAELIRVPAGVE